MNRTGDIYLFAIAASIVISAWISTRLMVVNPDAICYFLSAQTLGISGLHEAMQLCPQSKWPLYSSLLYFVVKLSHAPYALAGYVMDSVFTLVTVIIFLLILQAMGATRRVLWLGAGVILLSHEFNAVREYIVRDHGYWAFSLMSVLSLIYFFQKPKWHTALLWSISLFIATLFRIEGVFFLISLPFAVFFLNEHSFKERVRYFFTLNMVSLLSCFSLVGWLLFHPQYTIEQLGRLTELLNQAQSGFGMIVYRYLTMKAAFARYVITPESAHDAGKVLMISWAGWYLLCVIEALSWIYALLVVFAWMRRSVTCSTPTKIALNAYILVNVVVTFIFLLESQFLSKRYLVALSLLLMLWVPFALNTLLDLWSNKRYRVVTLATAMTIVMSALIGLINAGGSKMHIRQAGAWLAANVPANASLYVNDYQLMYYSQHFGMDIFTAFRGYKDVNTLSQNRWKQYDYLALRTHQQAGVMTPVLPDISIYPVQVFKNNKDDQVAIYKVLKKENAL